MQDEPKRKPLRLPEFPYTQAAYYFVTVCCKGKAPLFGRIVGNGLDRSAAVFTGWVPFLLIFDVICGKEEK